MIDLRVRREEEEKNNSELWRQVAMYGLARQPRSLGERRQFCGNSPVPTLSGYEDLSILSFVRDGPGEHQGEAARSVIKTKREENANLEESKNCQGSSGMLPRENCSKINQFAKTNSAQSIIIQLTHRRCKRRRSMAAGMQQQQRLVGCGHAQMYKSSYPLGAMLLLLNCLLVMTSYQQLAVAAERSPLALTAAASPKPEAAALHFDDSDADVYMSTMSTERAGDDSDNFTPIPNDNNGDEPADNDNGQQVRTTTTTTRRPPLASGGGSVNTSGQKLKKRVSRVSDAELMAFSEFNVQQPTFNELIKTWPPTTMQHAAAAKAAQESSAPSLSKFKQQLQLAQSRNRHQQHYQKQSQHLQQQHQTEPIRNYLNEDLDDSIVTADESFERDQTIEPQTWINYLGDLGDYIYYQLKMYKSQAASSPRPAKTENGTAEVNASSSVRLEVLDELLDDYYYDQYENSQVLYYGPQLVREGDIFEIGCYMPLNGDSSFQLAAAEWTKSGKLLASGEEGDGEGEMSSVYKGSSPRVIRRSDYLGAKQNYSLKVFEAALSDSGNYRCNRMSRKYHKLVVVPQKISNNQLYLIQQRLLSIVNPKLMSPETAISMASSSMVYDSQARAIKSSAAPIRSARQYHQQLLPAHIIIEYEPLVVQCNISDEYILRRLRENPSFQLTWYKNGKQLRGQPSAQLQSNQSPAALPSAASPAQMNNNQRARSNRLQQQQSARYNPSAPMQLQQPAGQIAAGRIQFRQSNGRQLYISSAQYSDAGDYLCSWSRLPTGRQQPDSGDDFSELQSAAAAASLSPNPLAAGSLAQLMAPVKLRPFKGTYHVRKGNELRLICLAQRGYPEAQINWYIGNRLIDADYLRDHSGELKILNYQPQSSFAAASGSVYSGGAGAGQSVSSISSGSAEAALDRKQLVEINPIPISKHQMQLTLNGRGSWVEYRDLANERYSIQTSDQQLAYLQFKLNQLTQQQQQPAGSYATPATASNSSSSSDYSGSNQAGISVLVINSLDVERHNSRYACRATTRANTDEVTTVLKVQDGATVPVRPWSGKATLIPGQPLHFQCEQVGNRNANFIWFKRELSGAFKEVMIQPDEDGVEIHNDRLTLHKPSYDSVGDYLCRLLAETGHTEPKDYGVIKLRSVPYIEDFGVETGHTGKSAIVTDGERLELNCLVRDQSQPVNITWLKSQTPDDEKTMVPIPETTIAVTDPPPSANPNGPENHYSYLPQTFNAQEQSIIIEKVDKFNKKLIIESVRPEHRSYYVCMADNGVTERSRKLVMIRVKDKLIALWPFLGIIAELFILFTIIHVWETQRAYKEIHSIAPTDGSATSKASNKRPASGHSVAFESVPLTKGG